MKLRNLCRAVLLAAASTLAATAHAQTPSATSPQGTAAATKPAPAKVGHSKHKASMHKSMHAKHSRMTQQRMQGETPGASDSAAGRRREQISLSHVMPTRDRHSLMVSSVRNLPECPGL